MTLQPDLCRTCSETTLLVFSRDGSNSVYYSYRISLINYCNDFNNNGVRYIQGDYIFLAVYRRGGIVYAQHVIARQIGENIMHLV